MIDFLVRRAEDEAAEASESELRAFYQTESFRFERRPQYRVAVEGAAVPLPGGWLLDKEIEQRLGPSVARKLAELEVGESVTAGEGEGQYTIRLLERQEAEQVPFEEAREAVEAAYARERSEAAMREFLELARKRTDIRIEVER